jgi:predicted HicB family RNase H-like nuclease
MQNEFDGFTIHLFYDDHDQDWVAHFLELPTVSAFGDSPNQALEQLQEAWQGVKASYQKEGEEIPVAPSRKTYSGQFNVRIDKRLHKALAIEAIQYGVSLNALVSQKLVQVTPVHVD